MRQTKTISLSETQRAWLKEFSEKHSFKESEVVQMLINKASIDNILQDILVDKITAKKEGIKKTEVTSHNVQTVKQKDASKPIPRDISAKDNINYEEKLNNIYELWTKKSIPNWMLNDEWRAWYDIHPEEANKWARTHF